MKIWRKFFQALAILEGVYLVGTTLFLNEGFLTRLINGDSDRIRVQYVVAFSPIPGLVFMHGFRFRGQDDHTQWLIELKSARAWVDLPALWRREFHVTSVNGNHLSFRLRFRRSPLALRAKYADSLPPIPGLGLETPIAKGLPAENPWRVHIDGIQINYIREIWMEEIHFVGEAKVRGSFEIHPGRRVAVGPSRFRVRSGKIFVGTRKVMTLEGARVTGTIAAFHPDADTGTIFDGIDGSVWGEGHLEGLQFLNYYLDRAHWLQLQDGRGPVTVQAKLIAGKFSPDSQFHLVAQRMKARLWQQQAVGDGTVEWRIRDAQTRLEIAFHHFEMYRRHAPDARIQGENLKVLALLPGPRLRDWLGPLEVRVHLPPSTIHNLTYGNAYLPGGTRLKIRGGKGFIQGDLRSSSDPSVPDQGEFVLRARQALVQYDSLVLRGDVDLQGRLDGGHVENGELRLASTVRLRRVNRANSEHAVADQPGDRNWWATVRTEGGRFRFSKPRRWQATVRLRGRDALPLLEMGLEASRSTLPEWVQKLLAFRDLSLSFRLDATDHALSLNHIAAHGQHMHLQGWVHKEKEARSGRLLLKAVPFVVGLELQKEGVRVETRDPERWFKSKVAE